MMPDTNNFFKKSNDTSDKKSKVDDKEIDSKKYINLRPTMENFIKELSANIISMDFLVVSEGETINTADLIVDVMNESYEDFIEDLPESLEVIAHDLYEELLDQISIIENYSVLEEELNESSILDISQRRKKALVMRRHKAKILTARNRAAKRRASANELERRAKRKARAVLRSRFTGNKKYEKMTPSERIAIDRRMSRVPKSILQRMSTKMIPKVRNTENERLKQKSKTGNRGTQKTSTAINTRAVSKSIDRVGVVTQKKLGAKETVKEEIQTLQENVNINALFEQAYVKKSDLPKK